MNTTTAIIIGVVPLVILYIAVRLVLAAIIIYADMLKYKKMTKK